LILRHQLAVLQRRQPRHPKLNWADRALLAALLGVIPRARRYGLQLLVTPDTIVRWHRDIVRASPNPMPRNGGAPTATIRWYPARSCAAFGRGARCTQSVRAWSMTGHRRSR
jgi:hypothetical protein